MRRWASVALLVPMGVLLTHLLAYSLPHAEEPMGDHHHLVGLASVATVALAVAVAVLRTLRGAPGSAPLAPLSAAQCVAYAMWEMGEGLLAGASLTETLAQPTFLTGLVLQVAVALVLVGVLRVSAEVARRFATAADPAEQPTPEGRAATPSLVHMARQLSPATRRGPPGLLLS